MQETHRQKTRNVGGEANHVNGGDQVLGGRRSGRGRRGIGGCGHQLGLEGLNLLGRAGAPDDGVAALGEFDGERAAKATAHPGHQNRLRLRRWPLQHPRSRRRHPERLNP